MRNVAFPILILLSVCVLSLTAGIIVHPQLYAVKSTINFGITSENGTISYSYVEIKEVTTKASVTHIYAIDKRFDDQHKSTFTYRMNFWGDSVNWCEDALNYLNCDAIYSSNMIMEFVSDSLLYPYSMKVGDALPDATASETQLYSGTSNVRKIEFRNRKVIGRDSILVNKMWYAGFLIQSDVTKTSITDYGPLGKIPTELKYTHTTLFDPEHGVIRTHSKTPTGESTKVMRESK